MELFIIAVALAMDSAALCMANGAKFPHFKFYQVAKISLVYGFFQAIMPVFGYFLGLSFVNFISKFDHFVAFVILLFLGFKMIKEAFHYESQTSINLSRKELILGAIATSIDALAIGVTFSFSNTNICFASLIIGAVCFILCLISCYIGKKFGEILESKALMLGGIILIFLGVKILLEGLEILNF